MAEATKPANDTFPDEITKDLEGIDFKGHKHGPRLAMVVCALAASWSLFQLWIASPLPFMFGFGVILDVPARGIHLAFALLLCYLTFPAARRLTSDRIPWYDLILAFLATGAALYVFLDHDGLVHRQGVLLETELFGFEFPTEAVLSGVGIVLLLEATRRAIGLPLVVVAVVFLVYSVFGQSMPELLSHKGVSLSRLVGYQWLSGEAVFGIPLSVSVSFVFLFVLFGALLEKAGAGKYFLDLAFALVGKYRGGPAKAAILASGMTGAISGSSIANVVTTGTFTIPVMKRSGLPATKAGAIEVAASTNGQIMPPVMGAAAFVMAELIGIPYFEVVKAAFIPAIVSYLALLYISHLESLKLGLEGLSKEYIPRLRATFVSGLHYLLPILVLVYLLMVERWTAGTAVFYSILLLMMIVEPVAVACMDGPPLAIWISTAANYLVVASLLAGVVVELGGAAGLVLPLIAVHLFVFYFGILADDTPPVCLAAFAAAAISRADPLATGIQSFMYDIRTAILPFIFIFNPQLLLIGVDSWLHGIGVFVTALLAMLCFASATQGWMLVKNRFHESILLLVVTLALFRPGAFMDQVFPPFATIDMETFVAGDAAVEPGRTVRMHVTRETRYGDRYKLFLLKAPEADLNPQGLAEAYGLTLEAGSDGRYSVADLAFNGPAETAGLDYGDYGDYVEDVDVEQLGRPAKEWIWIPAFGLLGLVLLMQVVRWRRTQPPPIISK